MTCTDKNFLGTEYDFGMFWTGDYTHPVQITLSDENGESYSTESTANMNIVNASTGEVALEITPEVTSNVLSIPKFEAPTGGDYNFFVKIQNDDIGVKTVVFGKIKTINKHD